jgi:hypothetical protein
MNPKKCWHNLSHKIQKSARAILFFALSLLLASQSFSQRRLLNFQILRNGDNVGTLRFFETVSGDTDSLKMESNVRTKFLFTFVAYVSEYAVFYKGSLLQSSIYRRFNGSEKVNKQHRASNGQYIVVKGSDSKIVKVYPINYTMLSLYSKEPVNIAKVYSDNFESFLVIQKLGSHKYKIVLPDGNFNIYSYKDGALNLVEVNHKLYTAKIVLSN